MSTTVTERKSQTERAVERTEKLLNALKQASDIVETKDAIMNYISDIDCCSGYERNPFVLGDTDFAHLFVQSLERPWEDASRTLGADDHRLRTGGALAGSPAALRQGAQR